MEQDLRDEGTARSQHVVHVLPSHDQRIPGIARAQVERLAIDRPEDPALRLLVLLPAAEESERLAGDVNDGLDAASPLLVPVDEGIRGARRATLGATAIATSPALAQELLRKSALKVDGIQSIVLVHLDTLTAQGGDALDEILSELPKTADRIAITGELNANVEAFLERHARRARRMQYESVRSSEVALQYVVCDPARRVVALSRLLHVVNPEHATVIASEDDAEAACAALAHLGYGPEDSLVSFSDGDVPEREELVVLYSAPTDAEAVASIREAEPKAVIALVAPDELTSFLRVFGQSATAALPSTPVRRSGSRLDALRAAARDVMSQRSLHHELLALAPLFEERDAAEVAAALLALLEHQPAAIAAPPGRAALPGTPEPRPRERVERAVREERPERAERTTPRTRERSAALGQFTPVFISVGMKDGAKKGDLVGALTNESGISSDMLGKITMREMFSVVEVDSSVAEQVIEAITGKTIRGRVVNARPDRGPTDRGDRRSDDRPARRPGSRAPREDARPPRGRSARSRDDFGAGSSRGSRDAGGARGGRDAGPRGRRPREDAGGPRTFRDGERGRGPRAIGESREWGERGERLRHSRRPRREKD
ncbi:MAG: DbpA RNA binding domain-containing protein [Gemmatimonadaceae bacterium]